MGRSQGLYGCGARVRTAMATAATTPTTTNATTEEMTRFRWCLPKDFQHPGFRLGLLSRPAVTGAPSGASPRENARALHFHGPYAVRLVQLAVLAARHRRRIMQTSDLTLPTLPLRSALRDSRVMIRIRQHAAARAQPTAPTRSAPSPHRLQAIHLRHAQPPAVRHVHNAALALEVLATHSLAAPSQRHLDVHARA